MRSSPGVFVLICYTLLRMMYLSDTTIKGVQIGDHEIEQYILLITLFFLRDITCLKRMQEVLRL